MQRKKPSSVSVWRPLNLDHFLLGAPHYPEHIDERWWQRDAERMAAAGVNTVRMGEFAWHIFEPREGRFEFDLFDRAINVLGDAGIDTIMCTPTATPPRWLTIQYPEVLRVDVNGRPSSHGSRQHADTTSPVFRAHSRRITRAMAEHYRDNPRVIGWQTDNELNTTVSESFAPSTRLEFQNYLRKEYQTIEALNFAWGGHFWATSYDDFSQIELPRPQMPSFPSPGHVQDYHRFLAAATAAFQHDQVEILRKTKPDWFIFHNLGQLTDIDVRGEFGQDLDFLGFDIYPMLYDEMRRTGGHAATQALHLDICRSYTGNFIVPEQASGFGSQPGFSTMTPEPGEMRRMAMTSVARGADGVMFFRWRPAHFGAEIYWMGVIDHDDVPRRRFHEASRFFHEVAAIKDQILGTIVRMDVGIAGADFDNQEAHKTYPMGLPSPLEDATLLHRHCYHKGIACGFIHPEDDLSRLKVLYVPHWLMWKDQWNNAIETFVRNGGTLILSAMSGTRDGNNHVIREQAPGNDLSRLSGIKVTEFGRVVPEGSGGLFPLFRPAALGAYAPPPQPASSAERKYFFNVGNEQFQAAHLYELLEVAPDVEVVGVWSNRFAAGSPSITSRQVGRGRVVYVGTYLTPQVVQKLADLVCEMAGIVPLLPELPAGVEVTIREANDRELMFIQNTGEAEITLSKVPSGIDLLTGRSIEGTLELEAYGCAVLRITAELGIT
ncbi:beta-galactosidase [Bradyrhizobium sp. USDA 4472]